MLLKIGPYKYIRHPLYLGEILRNLGLVSILSSGYGILLVLIRTLLLLFRINMKEEMLVEAFGLEYTDYIY